MTKKSNNLSIIAIITTTIAVLGFIGGFVNQRVALGKEITTVSAKANKNEENIKMIIDRVTAKFDKQDNANDKLQEKIDRLLEHVIDLKSRG